MEGMPRLCIICCVQLLEKSGVGGNILEEKQFTEFCIQLTDPCFGNQVGWLSALEETLRKGQGKLTVCAECLEGIGIAVGIRHEAELVETQLMALQIQLLKQLRELKGQMEEYARQLEWIGKRIREGTRHAILEELLIKMEEVGNGRKRGRDRRRFAQKSNGVFQFRNALVKGD